MAVTYTSAAKVKKAVKWISASLLDADIENFIYEAESLIDETMRKTARGLTPDFTFVSTKHGILERAATAIAAFYCITYDVGAHPILESAEMSCNLIYYDVLRALQLLSDPRTVDHLSSL